MLRIPIIGILVSAILFTFITTLLTPSFSYAQKGGSTCDLCGYCQGQTKPPSHAQCISCVYDRGGNLKSNTYWTVAGCISTKPDQFVGSILNIVFAVSGGLAFMAFIGGSAMVLTSAGDPEKLNNGKSIIMSSVFGLLLILFSVFLLRVVGVDILKVPGFG